MTFEEAMLLVKAEGKKLKDEGRAFTINKAMRMIWEISAVEKVRLALEQKEQEAPAAPAPVSADAEAVARLTRVTPVDHQLGTLPGLRED